MSIEIIGAYRYLRSCNIPLFYDRVAAGFPSPAQDYIEQTLDLNELCVQHPAATYFVRAEGDSMIEAGIFSGDILVVDRALKAVHGDTVIACLDGGFTVKQLHLRPELKLLARNPAYPDLTITDDTTLELFGVVTTVVHPLRPRTLS